MVKDWQKRLKDTIAFIQKEPAPPGLTVAKGLVCSELKLWNTSTSLPTRQKLSLMMSREGVTKRVRTKHGRDLQRASILIKNALVDTQEKGWPDNASFVNNSMDSPGLFRQALDEANNVLHSRESVARKNLELLQTNPRQFLETYRLLVNGRDESCELDYSFYMRRGEYHLDCESRKPGVATIKAVNIPPQPFLSIKGDLGKIVATTTDGFEGANLVLTTQFSGCTYCFSVNGMRFAAAHIDPNANPDPKGERIPSGAANYLSGDDLSRELRGGVGFQNGNNGTLNLCGRSEYGPGSIAILAVKVGTGWQVWSQNYFGTPDGAPKPTDFSVKRLYPAQ